MMSGKSLSLSAAAALTLCLLTGTLGPAQQLATHPAATALPPAVATALTLEKEGEVPEAIAAWQKVIQSEPRNAQAYAHLGLLQARQEHYSDAIASYRKAHAIDPNLAQLNLNLGLALFKSGNFRESIGPFEAELQKSPDNQRLTILVAMAHYAARDYTAAIPYLKTAASRDTRNLPLRLALAHCYLWSKQFQSTLGVYKEILQIDPDSAEADMIAGEALDEKGDNAGAVQQFRAAEKANPKEPNVHFGLAYLLWAQKRYDDAIPEFEAELKNDPRNYQAMLYLGDTYVQMANFEKAKIIMEKAAPYEKSEPLVHLDLGIIYQELGNKELAVKELNEALKTEPDNVGAHFRLAQIYRSLGKKDEAKAEFTKASSTNKHRDDALYTRIAEANAHSDDPDRKTAEKPVGNSAAGALHDDEKPATEPANPQ
jgi:tetratricopeptide (TPR) repeat protein